MMKALIFIIPAILLLSAAMPAHADTLPLWVKKLAYFYSQNEISEQDFVSAIQYLEDKGIIRSSYSASDLTVQQSNTMQRMQHLESVPVNPQGPNNGTGYQAMISHPQNMTNLHANIRANNAEPPNPQYQHLNPALAEPVKANMTFQYSNGTNPFKPLTAAH